MKMRNMSCFLRDYSKGFNRILSTLNLKNWIDQKYNPTDSYKHTTNANHF